MVPDCLPVTEQWSVWWTASLISPAAPAQTTRETKLVSHNTLESSRRHELAELPTALILSVETPFISIDLLGITVIIGSRYYCFSCLLKLRVGSDQTLQIKTSSRQQTKEDVRFQLYWIRTASHLNQMWANKTAAFWEACSCTDMHALWIDLVFQTIRYAALLIYFKA